MDNTNNTNDILGMEYPYYNLMYELNVDNFKKICEDYSPIIKNEIPKDIKYNKKYLQKYNNKYVFIEESWEKNKEINSITDYFTEKSRIKGQFMNNPAPIDYWENNKMDIIKSVEEKNNSDNLDNLDNSCLIYELRESLFKNIRMCTNFKITVSLTILRMFNVKRWLDISAGWGDRLISAIMHDVDLYCGVDPNSELHSGYEKIINTFDKKNNNKYVLIDDCFENAEIPYDNFDTVFTSPPFFDVEKYSENINDSLNKYPNFNKWYNLFLLRSVKKATGLLKNGGKLILYINNGKNTKFIGRLIRDVNRFMKYDGSIYYYFRGANIPRRLLVWTKY